MKGDADPLTVIVTREFARKFGVAVRVLLAVSAVALALAIWRYTTLPVTKGLTLVVVTAFAFLVLLALAVLRPLQSDRPGRVKRRLWAVSGLATLVCIAGIAISWAVVLDNNAVTGIVGQATRTERDADRYLAGKPFKKIPTGVFIQSFDFQGANDVVLSGYVWQRIPEGAKIDPGVVLPEAGEAYMTADDPVYDFTENGVRTVGYYFEATMRESFDYSNYPLDRQNVWLRMWAKDFKAGAVLVPDFSSYPPWRDRRMLGIDDALVYNDWIPEFSVFSLSTHEYSSTFGLSAFEGGVRSAAPPDLYYNFGVKRDPMGPFNSQLLRWLFMALIVFGSLFLITIDEEERELSGFTTFELMGFAVGMLLVIIFDQNDIRAAVEAKGMIYLEHFSYASYILILLVGVNAILLTARVRTVALQWGGNLLPKLLYWPLLLGLVLIATLATFFG